MVRRFATLASILGLLLAVLAPAFAMAVSGLFGRDVRLVAPHSPDVVQVNKLSWTKGEPVADLYGIPSEKPIRVVFAHESRIIVPEEDPSLTLYKVDKQAGENPLQAQTLWFLAEIGVAVGVVLAGLGLALRSRFRSRGSAPATAPMGASAVAILGLSACGVLSGCRAPAAAEPHGSASETPARTTYFVGHDDKFVNIRLDGETDLDSLTGFTNRASGTLVVHRDHGLDSILLSIPVASFATGIEGRDAQLRSWLEATKFPEIQLSSRTVTRAPSANGRYDIAGELTLHGVTRPIVATVEATPVADTTMNRESLPGGEWLKLSTEIKLKLSDFGVETASASGSDLPGAWTLKVAIFAGTAKVTAAE